MDELQVRVKLPGMLQHPIRKIHSNPARRSQGSQQLAPGAANFQHCLAGRDNLPVELGQPPVILTPQATVADMVGKIFPVGFTG
jgi:hypothetical protein